jgi:hypothetical protein
MAKVLPLIRKVVCTLGFAFASYSAAIMKGMGYRDPHDMKRALPFGVA